MAVSDAGADSLCAFFGFFSAGFVWEGGEEEEEEEEDEDDDDDTEVPS